MSAGPPGKESEKEMEQRFLSMSEAQRASVESELEQQLVVLRRVRRRGQGAIGGRLVRLADLGQQQEQQEDEDIDVGGFIAFLGE